MASFQLVLYVYKGPSIEDTKRTRHAALFVPGSGGKGSLIDAANPDMVWQVREKVGYNPFTSNNIVGTIRVAQISENPETIKSVLLGVPIGRELEFNCQHWIGDALRTLVDRGYVTEEERTAAINEMVDYILQGEHDQP